MTDPDFSGKRIRQTFIDFFVERGHTFVPSSSLVPGGDQTLLFTNSGMVQFKDVFLGTDRRAYTRAVNSQKSMRVAGKHNDLYDVGRDDTHHTFFEMLGNWSFGDYYKEDAIAWAWELFTDVWQLPGENLWATCFEDELGEIPRDDEAAEIWRTQKGFDPDHVLFFGRKENFWEMAETGPCGPNSEIHIDRGLAYCDKQDAPDHVCRVNGDCPRFLELWNLVFIQYNRSGPKTLHPLPKKHVDTGMGFERLVSVLQDVASNYQTDLLAPLLDRVQELTRHSDGDRQVHLTPYRVIADHGRAAAFLIADGVVPGNSGRNYVCRMIIRRAARFGREIGLTQPFLSQIAEVVINNYGEAYPELRRNQSTILDTITREERRFQHTLESGLSQLDSLLQELKSHGGTTVPGEQAFELYATYGLPMEITRDIARDHGLRVDEAGFEAAMDAHRVASGAGRAQDALGEGALDVYENLLTDLQKQALLGPDGVAYDPYGSLIHEGQLLALIRDGERIQQADPGERVEVILPSTCFYKEAGGQVSDTGTIESLGDPQWEIRVEEVYQPAAGMITHIGQVIRGHPKVGDEVVANVDAQRRRDIMRNHTATHLLHAELQAVLGTHARQAGSLVAPDRLRFDFTHPEALAREQLRDIETAVNRDILENHDLQIEFMPREQALAEGAIALFGEKYGETVRTIAIGSPEPFSFELCGGTHLQRTGEIGVFLITSEGSVAAGVRRIEAVTGRAAYRLIQDRSHALDETARLLDTGPDDAPAKTRLLLADLEAREKELARLRERLATAEFSRYLDNVPTVAGVPVLTAILPSVDADALRSMTDRFRQRYPSGVIGLASVLAGRPIVVTGISEDLTRLGLDAAEIVKEVGEILGGGGGGRPTLAQAGGSDPSRLREALDRVPEWVEQKLHLQGSR